MQYVIIGCSATGINAIESIRSKDKDSKLIVISDEKTPLYSRCLLSYLLSGSIKEDKIWYRNSNFFEENKVEALLGIKAEEIDMDKKEVILENNKNIRFDRLLIATGSSPNLENIPGVNKKAVYPLRNLHHASEIESILSNVQQVAILGGGLIGLRAAYALKNRGKKVFIFVKSPHILSQMLDKSAGDIIQKVIEGNGIEIKTQSSAKEIVGNTSVKGVILTDNTEYPCELVIIGKGVSPNIEVTKETAIKINRGILVDEFLRTSSKDIFSAGDVAETLDIALGETSINAIWPSACEQGRISGLNMLGEKHIYDGSLSMNSLEFFGMPVISIGVTNPKTSGYKELIKKDVSRNIYKKVIIKDGIIVGAILVNKIGTIGIIGTLIKNKVAIKDLEDIILEDSFDYGKIIRIVKDSEKGFKEQEFRETVRTL